MKSLMVLFKQLGFDEGQAQLFQEVATTGPVTVLELSRVTDIKRTTVHFYIEQLIEKGLVTEGVRRGRRVLTAVGFDRLTEIVEEQKLQVAAMEKSLERVLKEASNVGKSDTSYGIGFTIEDGMKAVESVYREGMESGDVLSYLDLIKIDGLAEVRMKLFADVALRQSVFSFKELYNSRDPGTPDYVKKVKAYKPFQCIRSSVKLSGNVVNVLVYDHTVAFVLRDTEWKVMKISQPMIAQLLASLMESLFLCK